MNGEGGMKMLPGVGVFGTGSYFHGKGGLSVVESVFRHQLRPCSGPTAAGRGIHGAGPVGEDRGGGQAAR